MKIVIQMFIVFILSQVIQDWLKLYAGDFWEVAQFFELLILWGIVDTLSDVIYKKVSNKR